MAGHTGGTPLPAVQADRYTAAVEAAARRGLRVWVEADLARRWLDGRAAFDAGVTRLGQLASLPGVVGFKIADELGYGDGFDADPAGMRAFLHAAATALRGLAPGKRILIDLVVPELGCGAWLPGALPGAERCRDDVRAKYPSLRLEEVDQLVAGGDVDVIDLSTYLQSASTYASWGTSREEAQVAAWREVARHGWGARVTLQARHAAAEPGGSSDTPAEASERTALYVDIPRHEGAAAADIWTWRQTYKDQVVSLLDGRLDPNPLWRQLAQRRSSGLRLFTHFTPSSVHQSADADLDVIDDVFTDVFLAAGIG